MKKILIIAALSFCLNAFAAKLVFMVESIDGSKQIGKLNSDKSYSLLTKANKWHLYPDINKAGTKLTYVKGDDPSNLAVYVKDLRSNKEIKISNTGFTLQPKFAARESKIFYSIKVQDKQKIAIFDVNSKLTSFIDEADNSYFPAPFQSAETLVYQRNSSTKEIILFDMLNNKKEVIDQGMSPSLSMDEKFIAYTKKVNGNWDIYIYNRFTKKTIKVTTDSAKDFSPVFDKDNNLVYTSDRLSQNSFSIFKQSYNSWSNTELKEELILSKKGVSFYAPRFSGLMSYRINDLNPMQGRAKSSFGAIAHDGHIYTIGGHQGAEHTYPPESFSNQASRYNIKTKKWEILPNRSVKAHGFQLAVFKNYIYTFGGFAYEENNTPNWKSIAIVERLNTETLKWEIVGQMPRNRSSNTVSVVDDKAYLIGGWDATPKFENDIDGVFHDEIDIYDFKSNTWTTSEIRLPKKRRAFSSFVKDKNIYLVGGISEGGSHFVLLDDFTQFDPDLKIFTEFPKLPFPTFAPASGLLDNKGMIFGGMFKTGKWDYEYVPHIYEFNFYKNSWSNTGRYLREYKGFSQVVKHNKCLAILGGHSYKDNQDSPLNSVEKVCK